MEDEPRISVTLESYLMLLNNAAWCCAFDEALPKNSAFREEAEKLVPAIKDKFAAAVEQALKSEDQY